MRAILGILLVLLPVALASVACCKCQKGEAATTMPTVSGCAAVCIANQLGAYRSFTMGACSARFASQGQQQQTLTHRSSTSAATTTAAGRIRARRQAIAEANNALTSTNKVRTKRALAQSHAHAQQAEVDACKDKTAGADCSFDQKGLGTAVGTCSSKPSFCQTAYWVVAPSEAKASEKPLCRFDNEAEAITGIMVSSAACNKRDMQPLLTEVIKAAEATGTTVFQVKPASSTASATVSTSATPSSGPCVGKTVPVEVKATSGVSLAYWQRDQSMQMCRSTADDTKFYSVYALYFDKETGAPSNWEPVQLSAVMESKGNGKLAGSVPLDLIFEWGNFANAGNGVCVSTVTALLNNAKSYEEMAELKTKYEAFFYKYGGCTTMYWFNGLYGDSTGHIDLYLAFGPRVQSGKQKVLIASHENLDDSQSSPSIASGLKIVKTIDNAITALAAKAMAAAGFEVVQVPFGGFLSNGAHVTYINALPIHGRKSNAIVMPYAEATAPSCSLHCAAARKAWESIYTSSSDSKSERKTEVVLAPADKTFPLDGAAHCLTKQLPAGMPLLR